MNNARFRITIEIDDAEGRLRSIREAQAFARTIGAGPGARWDPCLVPAVDVVAVEPVEVESERAYEERRHRLGEEALTQIQHISYDAALLAERVEAGEGAARSGDVLRRLTGAVGRICAIAEGCRPDEHWQPLILGDDGDLIGGGDRLLGAGDRERADPPQVEMGHPAIVHTLAVEGREEGLYLFADPGDRNAFGTAVESEGGRTVRGEAPLNDEATTKALIGQEVQAIPRFEIAAIVRVEAPDGPTAEEIAGEFLRSVTGIDGRVVVEVSGHPRRAS